MRFTVLVLIIITYSIQCDAQSAETWFVRGHTETDNQKKIEYYSNAIKKNPNYANAYFERGKIKLWELKNYEEAIKDFDEAVRILPNTNTYNFRGEAKYRLKKYDEALEDYTEAIRIDITNQYAYYNRGFLNAAILKKYEESIIDFDAAIKLDPKFTNAYLFRGNSYYYLGSYDKAITDYNNAISLDPKLAAAYIKRGESKYFAALYDEAINDFDTGISLTPNGNVYNYRGAAKNKIGKFQEAILDFNEAIGLNATTAGAYRNRAYSNLKLGKNDAAMQDITTAISLDPKDARAYICRGMIYAKLGKTVEAKNDFIQGNNFAKEVDIFSIRQNFFELSNELASILNIPAEDKSAVTNKKQNLKKVALVIGVKSYTAVPPLTNTLNDAKDIAASLRAKGFEVIELLDPRTKSEMRNAAIKFSKALEDFPDGIGMLYYSGHGMQIDGANYLIPAAATLDVKADVQEQCMDMDYFLRIMESNGNHLNIVVLDACRNNPFRSFSRAADKGLSMVSAPKGSYIVYSTKPGSVASDGVGRNGLFTSKLLKYLNEPNLSIEQVFKRVAADVSTDSNDSQRPWIASDYTGEFYFNKRTGQ